MSEELYFNDELRKCLNAAGLSDCGENYAWNYWYQRVYKAHNQTIDRVTEVQRAENAKLRDENSELQELALTLAHCAADHGCDMCPLNGKEGIVNALDMCDGIHDRMRQLGVVK